QTVPFGVSSGASHRYRSIPHSLIHTGRVGSRPMIVFHSSPQPPDGAYTLAPHMSRCGAVVGAMPTKFPPRTWFALTVVVVTCAGSSAFVLLANSSTWPNHPLLSASW